MKFVDPVDQYYSIKEEIDDAIRRVLESGTFIGGKEVEEFEKEIAKFCATSHAISVNSGTDALFLSLKALGIGKGDEVITTPFTFIATTEVIANVDATAVFADIDSLTFTIDPSKIEKCITKRTKAIIPVHLFGQMADMDAIMKIAKQYKLFVIEDAAQAIGAEHGGKKAGTIGIIGCFSFFPTKNLGAYGDAGMIITKSAKIEKNLRLLKNHGSLSSQKYRNVLWGINSRLDAIQAAILRVKLPYLNQWNENQRKHARYYNELLKNVPEVNVPSSPHETSHVFHQYTIRAKKQDQLKSFLQTHAIPTMIYYPLPLHLQPALRYLGYKRGDFLEAEKAAKEVLSLPLYPGISQKEQVLVAKKIREFYEKS